MAMAALLAATPAVQAYDFSAPATSNHTLYFNIIDSANHYVALTYPNENSNYITGDLVVPATVQHDGQTWTVRSVGHAAFINCPGMTSCVLPETVVSIGRYNAFGSCHNMTSITLPASLKSIDQYAFYECDALQEVHFTGTAEQWCKIRFINWNSNPLEQAHTLIINGDTVRDLVLQEGLDTIRFWAFKGCNLRSVSLPHSIRYISYHAFENCDSLTTVYFNADSAVDNGYGSEPIFVSCPSLTNVIFGDHLTQIPSDFLMGITTIETIQLPASLRSIASNAFANCHSLRHVNFNHTHLESIGGGAFYNCTSLENADLSRTPLASIGSGAFQNTGISHAILPRTCTNIGSGAFRDDTLLHYVCIMADSIGWNDNMFSNCPRLDTVRLFCTVAPFIPLTEESFNTTTHFFVPCGSLQTYLRQFWWRDFNNYYTPLEELPAVAVLVYASEGGSATVLQEPTCDSLTAVIEAVADSGYHFTAWSDGDTNALRTLTVGADDIMLTALFASNTVWHTVTVTANEEGVCEPYGSGTYPDGDTVEIGFHLLDTLPEGGHWQFVAWSDGPTETPRAIVVTSDTAIAALFVWVADGTEGIGEIDNSKLKIEIHPNPSHGDVTISVSEPSTVSIVDLQGRAVFPPTTVSSSLIIPRSSLRPGTYFVRIGKTIARKIVIL